MKNQMRFLVVWLLMAVALSFSSCEKEEDTIPRVVTEEVTDIQETYACFRGEVKSNGGHSILETGFCYGKNPEPTLVDSVLRDKISGNLGVSCNRLEDGTDYYVRAFATNALGTGYGNTLTFSTPASPLPKLTVELKVLDARTATCVVNVTSDGGSEVAERGVVWGQDANPYISESRVTKIPSGSGIGEFTLNITGLCWATTYHLRGYATNSSGTKYGKNITFTTPTIYGSFTDSRDGNVYRTLKIGSQTWMADNLRYLPKVTHPRDGSSIIPYAYVLQYYGEDVNEAKESHYYKDKGVLYNLTAAQLSSPEGWHLPTDEEWKQLELEIGMTQEEVECFGGKCDRGAGVAIKLVGENGYASYGNLTGTNETGFDVKRTGAWVPYGYDQETGIFDRDFYCATFWTNTPTEDEEKYYMRDFTGSMETIRLERSVHPKCYGFNVRCVKDE